MGAQHKKRFWRIFRICFRSFRILVWLLILVVLATLLYINQVGLPDFVKRPLLEKLRAVGLDLQFSRLRLRWDQGIVAENVHFGPADQQFSPRLNVAEVQVRLDWNALAHLQIKVDSLMLRQGRVSWALVETNRSPQELSVANIQTDLRFLSNDQWALDNFKAQFAGANIHLWGAVTNASAVRDWKIFQGGQPASRSAKLWQDRFRRIADTLDRIRFSAPPDLRVNIRGDALDLQTFKVLLSLSAPGAQTPWGSVSRGQFIARLYSVDTNGLAHGELELQARDAQTQWGAITNFLLHMHLTSIESQTNLVHGELKLSAGQVHTQWATGSNALLTGSWIHSLTNPIPTSGQGRLSCAFAQTSWGSASAVELKGELARALDPYSPSLQDEPLAWWTNLQPYRLSWNCQLSDLQSTKLAASRISCAGDWRPPRLALTNLDASLFDGHLAASADLDVATRAAHLTFTSNVDPHRFAPLLPESAQHVLEEISWPTAPQLNGELSVTLPAWTNREPDWKAEVRPTLQLQGELQLEQGGTFRNLQATSAHSHFVYSNRWWHLPDLTLSLPEGRLQAELRANELTKDFYGRLSSALDPGVIRPLLGESAQRTFDLVTFSEAPAVEVELWGCGQDAERIGFRGQVAVSNLTFRGQSITALQTQVQYTNCCLLFLQPRIELGDRYAKADGLKADFDAQLVYLTNGFSTADPMVIARAIGPQIARAIEAYRFTSPPTARVQGTIPMHGEEDADLHFDLEGGPFQWWRFNVPHITGHVHWSGLHLTLTNVQIEFYQGTASGWAAFDFPRNQGTDFQFTINATNFLLHALVADLSTHTNRLEGRLSGALAVTKANSDNWQTVFGYGDAHLSDGLLWDIPLFGIFSPILNGIAPGLGNSRASAAATTFIITNGVIRANDLEIRSTAMRLQYRGTVNLESQINARVEAELLRDMWLVGPLVSTVFWPVTKLFEYRVTGTLAEPRTEPVFMLPKIMLLPLHPLRTLKGLFPEDPNSNPNFSPVPP